MRTKSRTSRWRRVRSFMVHDYTQHTLSVQSKKLLRLPGLANRTSREACFLRVSDPLEVDPVGLTDTLGPAAGAPVEELRSPLREVRLALHRRDGRFGIVPDVRIQGGIGQRAARISGR